MTTLNVELYDALIAIKVPEKKARAAAAATFTNGNLVTKEDLTPMKIDLAGLKAQMRMMMWIGGISIAVIIAMLGYLITLIITLIA